MRILLINQYYPPDTAATGQLLSDVAAALARNGHQVHVLCSTTSYDGRKSVSEQVQPDRKSPPHSNRLASMHAEAARARVSRRPPGVKDSRHRPRPADAAGRTPTQRPCAAQDNQSKDRSESQGCVHVHRVTATNLGNATLAGRLLDYASFFLFATVRGVRLGRMDVCIALTTPPYIGLIGSLLKRIRGTRLVLWTMDLYPEIAAACGIVRSSSLTYRVCAALSRGLYRRASAIISLGWCMTARLIEAGVNPHKIVAVDNWAPGECVAPIDRDDSRLRRGLGLNGQFTIMHAGNFGAGHHLHTLTRSLARIDRSRNWRIVFAGNTRSRDRFARLASASNLTGVRLTPPVPLDRLSDSLAAGDVHVVSQKEGTQGLLVPSKIYGLMAAGRPILFIGPAETEAAGLVRNSRCGLVIRPGDFVATEAALRRLAEDLSHRRTMGANARAYYLRHLGRDRSVRRIVRLVERVALPAASPPSEAVDPTDSSPPPTPPRRQLHKPHP